jgi:uncharacterized protein
VSATETKGTALIIGASGGIGAIYADRRGYDLILVGGQPRPPRGADPAPEDETGRSVETIAADLTDKADLARIDATLHTTPSIMLLVNNSGVGATAPLLESDVEKIDEMIWRPWCLQSWPFC